MSETPENLPIFVDLDGTLIKSDVSFESFVAIIKKNPFYLFAALFWLIRGKPYLKDRISKIISLNSQVMPYNEKFLNYLREEKDKGRKLILVSASNVSYVRDVSSHLGIFDDVIGTETGLNIAGQNKLDVITEYCRQKGWREKFAYAGNSSVDIHVWKGSAECILVSDNRNFARKAGKELNFSEKFVLDKRLKALLRSLRPYQWSKNLLLFVPVIMGHKIFEPGYLLFTFFAFLAFSFCASAVYIINDLFDLETDRLHRNKKFRPLASGDLQIKTALLLIPMLLILTILFSLFLPLYFTYCLLLYLVVTFSYTLRLKSAAIVDVITLSMLYVLRIFAGGMATGIHVSQWLLSFSLFVFISLACLKRFSELRLVDVEKDSYIHGRGYKVSDMTLISQFGTAGGYLSVFVLVFYINSKEVLANYSNPLVLWFLCPLIVYWISRIWLLAHRAQIHEDPVVFALRDAVSYFVGILVLLILFIAT